MINVIGLGITDGDISTRGVDAVRHSKLAVFKTAVPATYALHERIDIESITLDDIYTQSDDFDDVNRAVADRLEALEREKGDIAYLIGGSGVDDRSVDTLIRDGANVAIYPACAKESTFDRVDTSYLALSAYDLVNEKVFMPDTAYPIVVKDIDNRWTASEVKLILTRVFDDDTPIKMTTLSGIRDMQLYELDRQESYDYYTAIYIKNSDYAKKHTFTFSDLVRIMYRLRDRETGCQWDKAQTHESIRRNVIEEAYELVSAIDNGDIDNMLEECGDILLQSVFHAAIAEDMCEFDMYDVISTLCTKLVTRHTHIFGDVVATTPEEALDAWNKAKAKEKSQQSFSQKLRGISEGLPQIMRAEKVQKQASKRGLDFPSVESATGKIMEELNELLEANEEDKELEAGDLLFSVINVLRLSGVEGEVALRRSTDKFMNRCIKVEEYAVRDGVNVDEMSAGQFDAYWDEAKSNEDR